MGCRLQWVYVQLGAPRPSSTTCLRITVFHRSEGQAARAGLLQAGELVLAMQKCVGETRENPAGRPGMDKGGLWPSLPPPTHSPLLNPRKAPDSGPAASPLPAGLRGSKGGHPASLCRVQEVARRFIKAIFKKDLGTSRM